MHWQPGLTLDDVEKEAILQAYRFYRGNKTHTAKALGIAIRTLDHKLDRYAGRPTPPLEPEAPVVEQPKKKK